MSAPFARYLARRLLFAVVLVFVAASASLLLARLAPGDYARDAAGVTADPELVARLRARYGLDQPVLTQYGRWLARAATLDFGTSYLYGTPVASIVVRHAANTAILAASALVLATALGIPLGVFTGTRRRDTVAGTVVRGGSVLLLSTPPLLMSLVLVFIAARTHVAPAGGMSSLDVKAGIVPWIADVLTYLPVPALALALPLAAMLERVQSQAMREAMGEPCIRATMAKGVPRQRLIWRDAFRLSGRSVASIYGLIVGTLFSGSFIVENVTSWPGLGRLMFQALSARDVYLVGGVGAAGAVFLAAGSLLSDVAAAAIDPRVPAEGQRA